MRFGEYRNETQLVQELIKRNKENNSTQFLGDKIRNLKSSLILADPLKRNYYEKLALETFLDKINPLTAVIIKLQNTVNLDQAIAIAKQEEKKLREKKGQNFKNSKPKF